MFFQSSQASLANPRLEPSGQKKSLATAFPPSLERMSFASSPQSFYAAPEQCPYRPEGILAGPLEDVGRAVQQRPSRLSLDQCNGSIHWWIIFGRAPCLAANFETVRSPFKPLSATGAVKTASGPCVFSLSDLLVHGGLQSEDLCFRYCPFFED